VIAVPLFVPFGVGVFEDEALSDLPTERLAVGITGVQVVLLGMTAYLAVSPTGRHAIT